MPANARRASLGNGALAAAIVAFSIVFPVWESRAQDAPSAMGPAVIVSAAEIVLLRAQPGCDAAALASLSDGSPLDVTGEPVVAGDGSSWLPVVVAGQSGFVPAGYVAGELSVADPSNSSNPSGSSGDAPATAPLPEPATAGGDLAAVSKGSAVLATNANLRVGPSSDNNVMQVIPTGSIVSIDGEAVNGFVPVTANGISGWVAAELLTTTSAPASSAAPAEPAAVVKDVLPAEATDVGKVPQPPVTTDSASTGIVWPISGGEWQVVQGYSTGTHTNRGGFAQYKYSLDWARVDGNTAGQPVTAPVPGTVQWVDRGSGGVLIDAGNGYGVALFHVTLDRNLSPGSRVERGQSIGEVSGPGGDGYMSMAHLEIAVWQLDGRNHTSVPFTGPNAIGGQEFPDTGGANQYMGTKVAV